ncbi:uncharacterized protein [Mytilus edulis]|uniref:uncharacterized protein n=1 Tax=Mytilus edulis TaxID=6550 RepID=UPI0039EE1377
MVPCRCEYRRKLEHWGSKIIPNLTREELLKELESELQNIKKELKVNKTQLSSSIRRPSSATNKRKSSKAIGLAGAAFICIVVGLVVLVDVLSFVNTIKKVTAFKNWGIGDSKQLVMLWFNESNWLCLSTCRMLHFVRLFVISMFPLLIGSHLSKLTCPTVWESHGFKCYKMSHQYSNFSNAVKYCNDQNAELIMPKTVEEQNVMKTLLRQLNSTNVDDGIWIGLNLVNFNASERIWIWNDGTQLDSANMAWNPGEPQRYIHENCVVSPRNTEKWHDVTCHTNHVFSAACQLKDMIVNEGESVNLTCGVSDLQTKWTRSVNDTSVIVSEYANDLTLPSLVLDSVKWSDQGSYKCSFTNTAGLLETRLTRLFVNTCMLY